MIYTSNFSKIKKIKFEEQMSIAIGPPSWYEGFVCNELRPTWEIVIDHKNKKITDEQYTELYYEKVLNKLDPFELYKKLDNKVLLCWCGQNKFCHRYIVSKWFNDNGLDCKEL